MPSILVRTRALLVALAGVAFVSGCDKATGLKAQFPNLEAKPTVWAMNGTAVTLPSGLSVRGVSPVRIDATFLFDLAFDLDASNVVQVYTLSRIANELAGTHRVGIQSSAAAFASLLKAPTNGYSYDTVLALPIGKTILVDVSEASCSTSFLGANIHAKLSVDSVNTTTRAIYLHLLSDPNCGFRALDQGTPKS
jgi:hypothetical protein